MGFVGCSPNRCYNAPFEPNETREVLALTSPLTWSPAAMYQVGACRAQEVLLFMSVFFVSFVGFSNVWQGFSFSGYCLIPTTFQRALGVVWWFPLVLPFSKTVLRLGLGPFEPCTWPRSHFAKSLADSSRGALKDSHADDLRWDHGQGHEPRRCSQEIWFLDSCMKKYDSPVSWLVGENFARRRSGTWSSSSRTDQTLLRSSRKDCGLCSPRIGVWVIRRPLYKDL